MKLSKSEAKFILHWGEMGNKWGINRTVAQIHALLFISTQPLNAEDISNILSIARSNVSTSLKELLVWEIIKTVHIMGDRREHYESLKDVWEIFRIIVDKRKRKEIDPTINFLKDFNSDNAYTQKRINELLKFFETIISFYEQGNKLSNESLIQVLKLGKNFEKLLSLIKK